MRFMVQLLLVLPFIFTVGCASQHFHSWQVSAPYASSDALEVGQIVHQPTGRIMTEAELYDYLGNMQVIYVGESHDSVDDHAVQLKVIQGLNERFPGKVAVGMEMLRTNFQDDADKWSAGELDLKEFTRVWVKSWGNTMPYYKEILTYVRDNKMPLLAMNRPRPKMSMMGHGKKHGGKKKDAEAAPKAEEKAGGDNKEDAATAEAAKAMPAEMPAEMPKPLPEPEIDYDDSYYNEFIGAFFAGHGEGKPEIQKMFLKGQLLWDETMAETGAKFLTGNNGMKLVVLAGGNHVRYGFGAPRRLFRRLPAPYAIIDTAVIDYPEDKLDRLMDVNLPELPLPSSHFTWAVNYTDLEDKRIMLGVGIKNAEPEGVLIMSVMPESSAEAAGILADDVIIEIDTVAVKELFDLTYALSQKEPDTEGKVTVLRGEERLELPVTYSTLKPHGEK